MTFDEQFKEATFFEPEGLYISRRAYSREEAASLMLKEYHDRCGDFDVEEIKPGDLTHQWVRFGPAGMMSEEIGDMAWMVCPEGTRGAQPVWRFLP